MATIYSYPRVENLTGDDVLLLSDSTEEQRTLSVSIGQVADYVSGFIQLGNNPSAIDFVSELQDYMSIEDNVLTIGGYATAGSVDTISSGLAELKIETQANLNGAISQIELRVQTDYQSYVNGRLASYSDTVAVQGLMSESTADLASAESFTILQSELGTFDENGNLVSLSESFANNVLSTSNTEDLARTSDVTNLTSRIFDTETGLLSESFANSVMSTENTTDYATSQRVTDLSSTVSTKPNIFRQNDIPATDEPAGSLWYNTSEGNKLYILVGGPPKEWQETDDSRIGPLVDSSATATQTLETHTTAIGNNSTFAINLAGSFGQYDAQGNITSLSESFANSVMARESATNYADAQKLTELGAIVSTKPNVYRQDDTPSIYSGSPSEQVIPDASIWYDTNDDNKVYIVDEDPSNVGVRIWTLTDDSRIGATASKITSMSAKFGSFDTNNNFSISGSSDYLDTVITTVDTDSATASKVSNLGAELGAFDSDNNFNTSLSADFKTAVNNEVDANSATAGYVNNLSAAVGIDKLDGTPQSQATALVNGGAGAPVTATLDGAVSGTKQLVLTAANSDIEVGQYVTYSAQDSTINRDLRWRVEAIEQENIFLDNEIYLENETTVSFTGNTSITVDNVSGTIREGFQIKGAGITPGTFVSVVDGNNITLSLAENLADDTELEFLGIYAAVKETANVVARVDGTLESTYGLQVDANGNVAGMKLLANNEGSEVSFLADSFKIYNDSSSTAPFEVVDGVVKIKQGAIGTITFGDLSDVPASFTTTVIYAEDTVGTNASTTKGTLTHVAFYNGEWTDGDSVSGITFDKITGTDGTSVNIIGFVDTVNDLPTSGVTNGDGYLVDGNLYVWDGSAWVNAGNIQGPQGIPGANAKTVKLSPSKHVISYSTVYDEENDELVDVENDTITFTATPQNIEGTATYKYYINNESQGAKSTTLTFELPDNKEPSNGESIIVKVELYDDDILVAEDSVSIYGVKDGYNPVKGRDYDDGIAGNNVRVEYSIDGDTWVTTQAAGETYYYIRTGVQTNGEGDFVYGPATKFVPKKGIDYDNGDPGVSSYLHIKYSNDGANFTLPDGEDVGDYIGTYVDSTEADSTTFSDYTWKKILGESALTSFLTNATHTISADSDGNVTGEYSEAGGAFKVLLGTTDITSQCEFAKIEENGVGVTIDNNSDNDTPNGVYIISQMTADSGTAIFQATVPNSLANTDEDVILTQTYSISKSIAGADGTSVSILGKFDNVSDLDDVENPEKGDGYLIDGKLHVWSETGWIEAGNIQGPQGIQGVQGPDGYKPVKGIDYYDGSDGTFVSFIYKVSDEKPADPTEGSYDGSTEVVPDGWTDEPSPDTKDVEWMSTRKYKHNSQEGDPNIGTWTQTDWSTPAKIFQRGIDGKIGEAGKSAYDLWRAEGNEGSEADFLAYLVGAEGPKGDSVEGPPGPDGKTTYTWIKYADSDTGSNMQNSPGDKKYIGFAFNKESSVESEDPAVYNWSLIKGEDGTSVNILGSKDSVTDLPTENNEKGDGYLIDGNLHVWNGTNWGDVGTIQGPQGIQGVQGPDGYRPEKGIDYYDGSDGSFTSFVYKVSDTQPSVPTGGVYDGVTETIPDGWTDEPSVETRDIEWMSTTRYSHDRREGETEAGTWTRTNWSTPVKIYQAGADGKIGEAGQSAYQAWLAAGNEGDEDDFLTYLIGAQGPQGDAIEGPAGPDGKTTYTWIKYADDTIGGNMSNDSGDRKYIGFAYNQESSEESDIYSDYRWSLIKGSDGQSAHEAWLASGNEGDIATFLASLVGAEGKEGGPGREGDPGPDGKTRYTWIKYAFDKDGNGFQDAPSDDREYIGLAFNKETDSESSDASDYAWYKFKGDQGSQGEQGPSGADGIDGTDGAYVSFIYKVSDTKPATTTGGSYNGTTETIPAGWTDDPTASVDDTEWVSSVRYYNTKTFDSNGDLLTSAWSKGEWSTPAIYYQRGAEGINGLPGPDGANGRRTAKGVVFYQSGKATAPTQLSSARYAFDFNEGSFINLPSYWGTETPEMAAGTASNQYWSSSYYVTENEVHHLSDPIDWHRGNGAEVSYASGEPGVYTISRTIAAQNPYIATHGVQGNSATYWKDSGTVSVWARGSGRFRLRLQEHGSNYTPYEDLEVTLTNTFVKYSLTGVNLNDGNNPLIRLTLLEGDEVDIYNPLLIADNSGVGRVVFQPPVRAFAFNQVVTFSALEASGSTTINGDNITTGTIDANQVNVNNIDADNITTGTIDASEINVNNINANNITAGSIDASEINVSNVNADNITTGTISANRVKTGKIESVDYSNTSGNGFSEIGMAVDLDNDSIHTPQFSIESDGSANFKGTIELLNSKELYTTATSTVTVDQSILIEPSSGSIKLAFDNMPTEDLSLSYATGYPEDGELILDSLGLSINAAGMLSAGEVYGFNNNGILVDAKSRKVDPINPPLTNWEAGSGQTWITGAYLKADSEASGYQSYQTPTATYGAVIERARLDGVIHHTQEGNASSTSSSPTQIFSKYAGYINKRTNSGTSYVKLPNDARKHQVIDVTTLYSNHSTRVYSGCTAGTQNRPGEHGDHRAYDANADKIYYSTWHTYVTVDQRQTERFIWTGTYWKRIVWDQ